MKPVNARKLIAPTRRRRLNGPADESMLYE
jgi:hypothetical protein